MMERDDLNIAWDFFSLDLAINRTLPKLAELILECNNCSINHGDDSVYEYETSIWEHGSECKEA